MFSLLNQMHVMSMTVKAHLNLNEYPKLKTESMGILSPGVQVDARHSTLQSLIKQNQIGPTAGERSLPHKATLNFAFYM